MATQFKIVMYLLTFPRSTDIKQVLNTLQTDKRQLKVPQDRLWSTYVDNKKKQQQFVDKNLYKCVTRPYLIGVPLREQTYEKNF